MCLLKKGSEFKTMKVDGVFQDYDLTIQYHTCKANIVVDSVIQNVVSMDSLAFLSITKRPFAKKIQTLKSKFI